MAAAALYNVSSSFFIRSTAADSVPSGVSPVFLGTTLAAALVLLLGEGVAGVKRLRNGVVAAGLAAFAAGADLRDMSSLRSSEEEAIRRDSPCKASASNRAKLPASCPVRQ